MPFDPKAYLEKKSAAAAPSGFDPSKYLADRGAIAPAPEAAPTTSTAEAALRGARSGVSLGFSDELSGAGGAVMEKLAALFGNKNLGDKNFADLYKEYRDAYRKDDKKAQADHPYAYGGSELAGGLLLPGGVGKTIAKKLALAAASGGANALGKDESDTVKGQVIDTALGMAFGLGGMGLGAAASKAIPTAAATGRLALDKTIRHLRPTPKVALNLGKAKLDEVAQEVLDSGAMKFMSKADETGANLGSLKDKVGKEIEGHLADADAAGITIDPNAIAARMESEVQNPLEQTAITKPLAKKIAEQKEGFLDLYKGPVAPSRIENEKRAAQGMINYTTEPSASQQAQRDYARVLKEAVENSVDNPAFKQAKKKFGNMAVAEAMADRTGALTDGGTGLMGHLGDLNISNLAIHELMSGEPIKAATLGAARALTKGKMASGIAVPANAIAQFLGRHPNADATLSLLDALVKKAPSVGARQQGPNLWSAMGDE